MHFYIDAKCKKCYYQGMEETLKELRKKAKLTQQEAAQHLNVSLRSYKSYENAIELRETIKYRYMIFELSKLALVDETHGVISVDEIKDACRSVFKEYPVEYCYLFGSYAKGIAGPSSDVDLLVSTELKGLKFYGMVEQLRTQLHKNVDVLEFQQLNNNSNLTSEILKNGVKIYG